MLGYSLKEIKNLGVMDIHPKEDLPYVREQFNAQLKKKFSLARDIPMKFIIKAKLYRPIFADPEIWMSLFLFYI